MSGNTPQQPRQTPQQRQVPRRFPILLPTAAQLRRGPGQKDIPDSVPWELVAPFEARARANHDQTLERLAQRGGLSPAELLAVLCDVPWQDVAGLPSRLAELLVMAVRDAWNRGPGPDPRDRGGT